MSRFSLDFSSDEDMDGNQQPFMDTNQEFSAPEPLPQDQPPVWMQTFVAQMREEQNQMRRDMQAQFQAEFQGLQNELRQVRTQTGTITSHLPPPVVTPSPTITSTATSNPIPKPRHSLPDPKPYDNKDRSLYPQFRAKLANKLRVDHAAIGPEADQIRYSFDRLEGNAAGRILPWMTTFENNPAIFRLQVFWEQMDSAFQDQAREQKALDRLNVLRQGRRPLDDLLRELDQLLLEAGGFEWSDSVKKGYLKAAMNHLLKDRMVTVDEKTTYNEYCSQVKAVADRLQELNRSKNMHNTYTHQKDTPEPQAEASVEEPMDWSYTVDKASGPRPKYAPPEEMDRRRRENACLRCGKKGHYIANCNIPPLRRGAPPPKPTPKSTPKSTVMGTQSEPSQAPPAYENEMDKTAKGLKE